MKVPTAILIMPIIRTKTQRIKMKYLRIFTGLLIGLLYIPIVSAQFPQNLTYQSIQPPNLILPNYLDSITDASVPDAISIKRITQYEPNWDWYPVHDYAKIQPWNADASIYRFAAVAIYDASTYQMIRALPGSQIYPCYWSNTNPDLLYSFRESGYIRTYAVSTNTVSDMNTDIQGYDIVKLGPGEGNIDKNDKYVALIGKRGSDMDVIVFDLQLNQIVHTETFAGAWGNSNDVPDYVDWVSVSQSGNYVGIMWNHNTTSQSNPFNNHYGVELYNTTDMQYLRRIAIYGNHGDFGYAQDGSEVFVQFWGPTGTLNMYYLNGNGRVVLSTNPDFGGEGHVSCRNINRPGYAYVSQDEENRSGQIIAFKLDNSGLVEHFGHHFGTASSYLKSPMPVPTPNGDKIMFKSDFGDPNTDVIYVFESTIKNNTTSVDPTHNPQQIILIPNPAHNQIQLASKTMIKNITIYNCLGQIVKKIQNINTDLKTIDVSNLTRGTYFVKIRTSEGIMDKKMMLN